MIIAHKSRKKTRCPEITFFYHILVLHHTKFHSSTLKIEHRRGVQTLKPLSGRLSSNTRYQILLWVRLSPDFRLQKCQRPKTRTDRRSRLSPDEARRKITQSTCDLYGVSTSRLPMYLYETTNLGVQRLLTGVYLLKLQSSLTVLRKMSMSSRKSQKTYVSFTSFAI